MLIPCRKNVPPARRRITPMMFRSVFIFIEVWMIIHVEDSKSPDFAKVAFHKDALHICPGPRGAVPGKGSA
jgi:hypothetical protein